MTDVDPFSNSHVYIVDDEPLMRESLGNLLRKAGFHCVLFQNLSDFLNGVVDDVPGCVILGLELQEMSGIEVFRRVRARNICKPLIFLTGSGSIQSAVETMQMGASDYLEKPVVASRLIASVQRAVTRDIETVSAIKETREIARKLDSLTPREREILKLISKDFLSKQIASRLGISIKTVEVHRSRLSKKLGISSAAGLFQLLSRYGPTLSNQIANSEGPID